MALIQTRCVARGGRELRDYNKQKRDGNRTSTSFTLKHVFIIHTHILATGTNRLLKGLSLENMLYCLHYIISHTPLLFCFSGKRHAALDSDWALPIYWCDILIE